MVRLLLKIKLSIDFVKSIACHCYNMRRCVSIPIYGILSSGSSFRFFAFDGRTQPSKFSMGIVQECESLPLNCFSSSLFIHNLRTICETVFNMLLVAYIANLKVFRDRSASGLYSTSQQKSPDGWDRALEFAEEVLEKTQDAEVLRRDNSIVEADAITETAFKALKLRYSFSEFIFPLN